MRVSKSLEFYGWQVKTHSELNSTVFSTKHKQTSFMQHVFLSGREEAKYITRNVGSFFIASNNILVPEAPKGSWIVPQMISLKKKGMIPLKKQFDVDFTENELNFTIDNIRKYLDEHMHPDFKNNVKLYAAVVWLNGMTYEDEMFDFITNANTDTGGLNILKYMAALQSKSQAMAPVFKEALNFMAVPSSYASRILM